jgi:hypothetical protein
MLSAIALGQDLQQAEPMTLDYGIAQGAVARGPPTRGDWFTVEWRFSHDQGEGSFEAEGIPLLAVDSGPPCQEGKNVPARPRPPCHRVGPPSEESHSGLSPSSAWIHRLPRVDVVWGFNPWTPAKPDVAGSGEGPLTTRTPDTSSHYALRYHRGDADRLNEGTADAHLPHDVSGHNGVLSGPP